MKKKEFLTEAKRKAIIADKEKAIIESFAKTFNKIKRIDENEIGSKKVNEYYDDEEMTDEEKAEQEALTQKYKKRILKNVPKFNEMAEKAVDGLGYPMQFKIYPTDPDLGEIYPVEIDGDKITISCSEFSDTYDLNNYNDYGDSWDAKINYWFTRFFNLLKKGVEKLEGGQNYYKYYIIDTHDNNRVLDATYTREDAESEKRVSYYDEPGARIISLKQLVDMGGKPLVVGGVNENEINEMERFDATAYQEKNNFNPTQRGDKYNVQYEIFYCDGSTCGNHMWKTVDVYANSEEEAIKLGDKELKHWEQFAFNGAANEFDELGEPMFKIERYEVYAIENESAIDRGDIERPSN